ncbi:hypothetical protein NDU88_008005 [Pleurodeles waltl]|uniref:Uncharacterized protein n=1 Tax=Pleurodeles waltl TaxID=8319 RepID=A0AAV7NUS2_PLEWA|nr:hypothetical protein NDU88_008005 [Pleurodeles waltl]
MRSARSLLGALKLTGVRGSPERNKNKNSRGDPPARRIHRVRGEIAGGPPPSGHSKRPRPRDRREAQRLGQLGQRRP